MLPLILSLLAISGISAILALLLEVADSYLADYGEKHILLNDQKDLVVEGGRPLLFTLGEEGIFIPSACGGKGTCSYCKVKIHEGGGPVLPTETPYLSPEEVKANVRLSCQVKVKEDLKVEIPEELFLVKEYKIKVERIEDLTPEIKGLHLKILTPEEGITFKPGQYVQFEVPKYKMTSSEEYRAYSIASGSEDHRSLELVITKVPKGAVTTYVHDFLKEGEELHMTGPYGDFYLRESDRDILMIATGSGMAPMKAMLQQIEAQKIQRKTTFFFGERTKADLFYMDQLEAWEKKMPHFTFVPTLSRATEEDQWTGEKGRVTNLIEKHIDEKANIDVYICGSPAMVESCVELLTKKGTPEDRVYFDKFE
ncbi:MAG: 2Fe-2S iron-sulfur cluster binding domain-containing protein [Proteobacteria bacterium]|nr:2Fe-2S iron-sulfur cluster binding domain-containing protein [Pseudomonadota bacterium]